MVVSCGTCAVLDMRCTLRSTTLQSNPEPLQRERERFPRHNHAQRLRSETLRVTKSQLVPFGSISFRLVSDDCPKNCNFIVILKIPIKLQN